jgi:hypothetical protein
MTVKFFWLLKRLRPPFVNICRVPMLEGLVTLTS